MNNTLQLHRYNAPTWEFEYIPHYNAYIYKTRDNTYRLFFEDPLFSYKPFWIGRLSPNEDAWYTVEKEIKAKCIVFCGSTVHFN